jgi:endonuclease YncB( thermonuclease family)
LAASLTTTVVSFLDGDTLKVLHNQQSERIRLSSIDCPEKGQAFGKRAKQAASGLAFRKEVIARPTVTTSTVARLLKCSCRMG